jgi:hypothetical protein
MIRRSLALAAFAAALLAGAAATVAPAGAAVVPAVGAAAHAATPARLAAARAAAAPHVTTKIVGKRHHTAFGPRTLTASATTVRVGRKRCAVAAGTPLAALLAARRAGGPTVTLADYGSCSGRAADGGGLYVAAIAGVQRGGPAGWVFAVGGRIGTAGAADPTGPFGSGLLRGGQKVVWFWCAQAGACGRVPS